jgi:hypothetical protein
MAAGRILNKLFTDADNNRLTVGGYLVRREQRQEYNQDQRRTMSVSYFWFEKQPE